MEKGIRISANQPSSVIWISTSHTPSQSRFTVPAIVRDEGVGHGTVGIGDKEVAISIVVEGVQDHFEVVVPAPLKSRAISFARMRFGSES